MSYPKGIKYLALNSPLIKIVYRFWELPSQCRCEQAHDILLSVPPHQAWRWPLLFRVLLWRQRLSFTSSSEVTRLVHGGAIISFECVCASNTQNCTPLKKGLGSKCNSFPQMSLWRPSACRLATAPDTDTPRREVSVPHYVPLMWSYTSSRFTCFPASGDRLWPLSHGSPQGCSPLRTHTIPHTLALF